MHLTQAELTKILDNNSMVEDFMITHVYESKVHYRHYSVTITMTDGRVANGRAVELADAFELAWKTIEAAGGFEKGVA